MLENHEGKVDAWASPVRSTELPPVVPIQQGSSSPGTLCARDIATRLTASTQLLIDFFAASRGMIWSTGRSSRCGRIADGYSSRPRVLDPRTVHTPARVNVTCVTPLGDEAASTS